MANLRDRQARENNPTATAVKKIVGKKEKYAVNIVFDGDLEQSIRAKAKEHGVGVATYIKLLVAKDLNG